MSDRLEEAIRRTAAAGIGAGPEIKKSVISTLGKEFYAAGETLKCDRSIVVCRGVDRFQADHTVEMMAAGCGARS